VSAWDELKPVLVRLREEEPGTLMQYPTPEVDENRQPPYAINLAPWAIATAQELHRQFRDNVELTVGALPYPPGHRPPRPRGRGHPAALLDPHEMTAELDGPAVVAYGHTLVHGLLLRNLATVQIAVKGRTTAAVVDLQTGEVVGGFTGALSAELVMIRIGPRQTERVLLLIGTASFTPRLGYAVPPGKWGIQATLTFGRDPRDSPRRRTPVMPLTITA
jgi:hypothetical protein